MASLITPNGGVAPRSQLPQPDLPPTMQPVEAPRANRSGIKRWYFAAFAAIQIVVIASAFLLAETPWFLWHDHDPWLRNFGYSQRLKQPQCDVLIYGDSSSLTGLDPAIIQQMTGLHACNIAEGTVVQEFVGSDVPLQAYLQRHAPPRFLIGTWTPSYFHPYIAPYSEFSAEGVLYVLQYGNRKQLFHYFVREPENFATFCAWTLSSLLHGILDKLTGKSRLQIDARAQRDARAGQWPYPLPVETHCDRPPFPPATDLAIQGNKDSVLAFRRKYATAKTTVILNVSPVPDCDASFGIYDQLDRGLHDNAFLRLPIQDFNQGDVHFSAEGSRLISEQAGREILEAMRHESARPEHGQAVQAQ